MLSHLDGQLLDFPRHPEAPPLPPDVAGQIASVVFAEVRETPGATRRRLRAALPIDVERYLEEMHAFQAWMDFAHSHHANPFVVRAQVITELYVAFVWLRDSLMGPLRNHLHPEAVTAQILTFLSVGARRRLRNAIAHGRWCYLPDFSGLEYWDGNPLRRGLVMADELDMLQRLARGISIAVLLALTGKPTFGFSRV